MARAWTDIELARLLSLRALSKIIKGEKNWPEVPFAKLSGRPLAQTLAALSVDLLGPAGVLARGGPDAVDRGKWTRLYSFQRYSTIGGGSTEVQKNIIADRAIKLPGQSRSVLRCRVDPRTPCIIGVARRTWRDASPPPSPSTCGRTWPARPPPTPAAPSALAGSQSLQVVYCQSWEYDDPCARLAERLGADPGDARPTRASAARCRCAWRPRRPRPWPRGELDLALIVGAEALATRRQLPDPAWSHPARASRRRSPSPSTATRRANGIFQAYLTFALLDTARRGPPRAVRRRPPAGARPAAGPDDRAWPPPNPSTPGSPWPGRPRRSAGPTPDNRMVATPYTKLMTAIMDVDMAAAVLLATEARADALGVPAGPAGLPAGAGRGRRAHGHGRPARPLAVAGPGAAASRGPRGPSASTRWPTSTSTPASPARCASPATPSGVADGRRPDRDRRASPTTAGRAATTPPTPWPPWPRRCARTRALVGLVTGVGMHMTSHAATLWSTRPRGFVPPEAARNAAPHRPGDRRGHGAGDGGHLLHRPRSPGPEWTALICDLPDGSRSYARLEEPAPDERPGRHGR